MSDLKKIPGIGDNMEKHLQNIGIHCIADLRGKDPEVLYEMDCLHKGFRDDRRSFYRKMSKILLYCCEDAGGIV